jgi:formylglycine-generating enzyme required for sulfatase activity
MTREILIVTLLSSVCLISGCPGSSSSGVSGGNQGTAGAYAPLAVNETFVRGGSFSMGSELGEDDERPVTRVQVEGFYIDKYEVTNKQYRDFLFASKDSKHAHCHPDEGEAKDHKPALPEREAQTHHFPKNYFKDAKYDGYPVVCIDWFDAYSFAAFYNRMLPSEAQFEYAARSSEDRRYPWGEEAPLLPAPRANFFTPIPAKNSKERELAEKYGSAKAADQVDGFPFTAPCGSFPAGASRFGALDLAGNVWEWTGSIYVEYGKKKEAAKKGEKEPANAFRVLRGGGWDSPSSFLLRSANRVAQKPFVRRCKVGFRTSRALRAGEKAPQDSK